MKVLCAIDGSAGSDAAVRLVGQLLSPERDSVVFYYSPPKVTVRGRPAPSPEVVREAGDALADRVFERARSMFPDQLAAATTTITGQQKPRVGILAAAKAEHPQLIAVGARGTGLFGLPRLGSVSRTVVHSVATPVLVARTRQRPEGDPLHLLLCCEGTESGHEASTFLHRFTLPQDAVGRVIHVTESLFGDGLPEWLKAEARGSESDPVAKAYMEERDEEVQRWRERITEQCGQLPQAFHSSSPVVLEGHPGEQIVKFVESEKIDLVAVGPRVLGPMARMFAGSTTEHILAHASSSVLVVPQFEVP